MEDLPEDGNITGGTFPARIWTAYMEKALEGTKVVQFPKAAGINKDADPPPPRPRRRARRPRRRAPADDERAADDERPAEAGPVEDEVERQARNRAADRPSRRRRSSPLLPAPG